MRPSFTRWLMSTSALLLGVLGTAFSFLPHEMLSAGGAAPTPLLAVGVQVLGSLYLGFAMLNWMTRESLIGGIYSRPVVVGNLLHFTAAGLALMKALMAEHGLRVFWPLALVYALYAAAFGVVLFRHPLPATNTARVATPTA
jgi:hypothetical protein